MSLQDESSGRNSSRADDDGSDLSLRKDQPTASNWPSVPEKSWKCPHCKGDFPPETVAVHLATHNRSRGLPNHQCAMCGAPFTYETFRDLHERTEHAYNRSIIHLISRQPYSTPKRVQRKAPCRHCGLLISLHGLAKHEQTHLITFGHQCAKCGSFLSTKGSRDHHERTFHDFDRRVQQHETLGQPGEQPVELPVEESSVQPTSSSLPPAVRLRFRRPPFRPTAPTASKQTTLVDELREKAVGLYVDLNHFPPNFGKLLVDFWIREPSAELLVLRCVAPLVCLPPFRAPVCSLRMDRPLQKNSFAHVFVKTRGIAERVRKERGGRMEFAAFASRLLPDLRLPSVLLVASPADRASVNVESLAAHRIFVFPQA